MTSINLLRGHHKSGIYNFDEVDSFDLYQKNLESQSPNWPWRDKEITYSYNTQGYRAKEWSDYNWNDVIIIFGCSTVFGTGVSFEQTVSEQLSQRIHIPVVNLGRAGSGVMFQWANTINLRKAKISPKAVIYLWPDPSRCLEFSDRSGLITNSWGSWDYKKNFGTSWILHDTHGKCYRDYVIENCNMLWTCPVYHFSRWPKDTFSQVLTDQIHFLPPGDDKARDLQHPGPETLSSWADSIYDKISL